VLYELASLDLPPTWPSDDHIYPFNLTFRLDSLFAWAARGYIDFESIRLSYAFDVHIYEFYFRTHFLLNYLIYLILVLFE